MICEQQREIKELLRLTIKTWTLAKLLL